MANVQLLTEDAARGDAAALLALGHDVEWHCWTEEHLMADRPEKWARSLVARDESDRPIAYAVASRKGESVHIHQVIVGRSWRGRGIGTALLNRIVEQAERDGSSAVTLTVGLANEEARRLYEKVGFVPMTEDDDQLVLELALRPAPRRVVACHQPNYAPWCGFFAKLVHSDLFVLLDDVQMPQGRSLVHRTRVAVQGEPRWLSVPCRRSSGTLIKDVSLAAEPWPAKHLRTLDHSYASCAYFQEVREVVRTVLEAPASGLAELNTRLIKAVGRYLGIVTPFIRSSQLKSSGTGQDRIISLVRAVNGTTYLSGPGARAYQEPAAFEDSGIELQVRDYEPIPYRQRSEVFLAGLSVLDALFNEGEDARALLRYG